jgi:uncharacterized protein with gpF-like domain
MRTSSSRRASSRAWRCRCVVLATLPVLAAQVASQGSESEQALKERVQVFWEAKVKEDYSAQYSFIEPKVRRQLSLTDYIKQQGLLTYLTANIDGV